MTIPPSPPPPAAAAAAARMSVEQEEEIEVLLSIYPDEYTPLPHEATTMFKINLQPNPTDPNDNHIAIDLIVELPYDYPSTAIPVLSIEIIKGLSKKHKEELKTIADQVANDNIGTTSIFTICEALKDWLRENNQAGQDGSMYSDMIRRINQKDNEVKKKELKQAMSMAADNELSGDGLSIDPAEEERIRRRQAGQQVTEASFFEWRAKFDEEMRLLKLIAMKDTPKDESLERVSGKQWFLQNAGKEEAAGAEDELIAAGEDEDVSERIDEHRLHDEEDDDDDSDYIDGEDGDDDDDDDEYDDEDV